MGEAAMEVEAAPEESLWYEEEIDDDLKWSFALNSVLHRGTSKYQDIALLDTKHFGKVLVIDGKMQSAEMDEFIYHECLIHPPLLCHPNPQAVFIMGGGEGSAAREVLRHNTVERVIMCDIDQEVVDFCRRYLTINHEAFHNEKLCLVINDAKAELENREETFDIIVGDLADPVEGGPCYQLYTKTFYENVVKSRLSKGGIFVTQAGPAGVLTHKEVFSSIYNTLKHVFKCTLTTRLEIHGTLGTFDHALAVFSFEVHGYQEKYYANLSGIGNESAKRFLEDYAETRRKEGLALVSDSILTYSDALYAGYKVTRVINGEDEATPHPAATAASSSSDAAASSSGTKKKKSKNRPDKPKSAIALQRERTKRIKLEDISHCFHLPITDASKELGMCTTALKKICRRNGVTRWPHRKVKSTDGMILKLKESLKTDTGEDARKTLTEINKLEDERNRVCEGWIEQILRAEREIGILQVKLGASRGVEIHKIVTEIAGLKEKIKKCKLKLDKLRKGKNQVPE